MDFAQVTNVESSDFDLAIDIYSSAFPINERQPVNVVKERVKQGLNHLYVGRIDRDIAFMALLWPLKETDFILLDYMATNPIYRGRNIASQFLQYMRPVLEQSKKFFILEVEDPEYGQNTDQRQKRIVFYKRNGAKELKNVRYILPPLQEPMPTEMRLMIFPDYANGKIDAGLVRRLIFQIYKELYHKDATDAFLDFCLFDSKTQVELI